MTQIATDVSDLTAHGVDVLSPSDPRVVDAFGEFLFVASDIHRNIERLQSRHLTAIRNSDFLWVTCPDGDIGVSTAMEIGAAIAGGVPVYALTPPSDLTLRQFVQCVPSLAYALKQHDDVSSHPFGSSLVLDPATGADALHRVTDSLQRRLEEPDLRHRLSDPVVARLASNARAVLFGL